MSFNYDLSLATNPTIKPQMVWHKNDRTKYLIDCLMSTYKFPVCVSEIITLYDYIFECILEHILKQDTCIFSTYLLHGNRFISEPMCLDESLLLWDLKNLSIQIKLPIPKGEYSREIVTLNKMNDSSNSFAVITSYIMCSDSYDIKDYNLIVREYDTIMNDWKIKFIFSGHKDTINDVINLNNNKIISCSDDRTIRIWDFQLSSTYSSGTPSRRARSSGICEAILYGHNDAVEKIYILPKNLIGSISKDKSIKIWDIQTYECKCTLLGHSKIPRFIGISFGDFGQYERIVTMSLDTIKIWDMNTYNCIHSITYQKNSIKYSCTIICIHQNGNIVAICDDNTIKIFNTITAKCDMVLIGHTDKILAITLLPDGKIASCSRDKTIRIWDLSHCDDSDKITKCEIISLDLSNSNDVEISNIDKQTLIVDFLKILPNGNLIGYTENKVMLIWK
jgi:WD40 repeat protein